MHLEHEGVCNEMGDDAIEIPLMPGVCGVELHERTNDLREMGGDLVPGCEAVAVPRRRLRNKEGKKDEQSPPNGRENGYRQGERERIGRMDEGSEEKRVDKL